MVRRYYIRTAFEKIPVKLGFGDFVYGILVASLLIALAVQLTAN